MQKVAPHAATAWGVSYVLLSFRFIPKIIRKRPENTLGLLISTTFIISSENYLQHEIPSMITHTDKIATRNFGGQKQLIMRPNANVIAIIPLETFRFRIFHPPILHYIVNRRKRYEILSRDDEGNAIH